MQSQKPAIFAALAAFIAIGTLAIAQNATTGRVFPYVGYLEENGFPVDGERDIKVNLYASSGAGTACDTKYLDAVTVANGRFQVDVVDVADACLIEGELFAGISVGPVGGALTDLTTATGTGRVQIGAVPFAAASPKVSTFLVENDLDVGGDAVVAGTMQAGRVAWGTAQLWNDHGGSIELGGSGTPYIDFKNDTAIDYDGRIRLTGNDELMVEGAVLNAGSGVKFGNGVTQVNGFNSLSCGCFAGSPSATGAGERTASAALPAGYQITGGGCDEAVAGERQLIDSHPSSATSWFCRSRDEDNAYNGSVTAYVCGCKLNG